MFSECAARRVGDQRIRQGLHESRRAAGRWRHRVRPGVHRQCGCSQLAGRSCQWGARMCLGVPGKVVSVDGWTAVVDFWGVRKEVLLNIVDEPVAPGDYILNHVGFAIRRIPPESVAETLSLYETLLKDDVDDLMASDVRGEINSTVIPSVSEGPGGRGKR